MNNIIHAHAPLRFSTSGNLSNSLIIINDVKDKTVFAYRFQLLLAIKIVAGQYKGNR